MVVVVVAAVSCADANDSDPTTAGPTTGDVTGTPADSTGNDTPASDTPGDDSNCPPEEAEVLDLSANEVASVLGDGVSVTDMNCESVCEAFKTSVAPQFAGCSLVPVDLVDPTRLQAAPAYGGDPNDTSSSGSDGSTSADTSSSGDTTSDASSSDDTGDGGGPAMVSCRWWYGCM